MKRRIRSPLGIATVGALLLLAGPTFAGARVPADLLARAQQRGAARVIVELSVATAPEGRLTAPDVAQQRDGIALAQGALAAELAGTGTARWKAFRSIPYVVLEAAPAVLAALERSPWVADVRPDRLAAPMLNNSGELVGADSAFSAGYGGAGQVVVVLDTGLDPMHQNFTNKVVAEACFASGNDFSPFAGDCPGGGETAFGSGAGVHCNYAEGCFHGTHVAGIAVGFGSPYDGVARDADVAPIQVFSRFDDAGDCDPDPAPCTRSFESDQIDALEYVYDTLRFTQPVAAVNLSLGDVPYTSQAACDAANGARKAAIDNLRSVGIATVASAGNGGEDDAISAPACISSAVSVGATKDWVDEVADFSNAAPFLSLWAPGKNIKAPEFLTNGFVNKSGTSMAAPHVAGAWAVLKQAAPGADVDTVLDALQDTGAPVAHPTNPAVVVNRIQVNAALGAFFVDCSDGIDEDGDGLTDFPDDPGCSSAGDDSEREPALVCDNGLDDDGDGLTDYPADPGCGSPEWAAEDPPCDDDVDNDGDGGIDWDGGSGGGDPDPQCAGKPHRVQETPSSCGVGAELVLLLPALAWWRRRRALSA